jgi:beta-phosphoglucomutase-like phosphatase (HAD superfamily)
MVYVTGDDVKKKKPDPELFLTAAARMGIKPGNCVVIEDAPNGVEAAKTARAKCIAVTNSVPASELSDADLICRSLEEIDLDKLRQLLKSK